MWDSTASRLQPLRAPAPTYLLPLSSQKFFVLILSTSEGYNDESVLEPPSGFEHGTRGLEIQRLNH